MSEWISIDDRLPENHTDVLCYGTNGRIGIGHFRRFEHPPYLGEPIFIGHNTGRVTHWMALPEPPKGKGR